MRAVREQCGGMSTHYGPRVRRFALKIAGRRACAPGARWCLEQEARLLHISQEVLPVAARRRFDD